MLLYLTRRARVIQGVSSSDQCVYIRAPVPHAHVYIRAPTARRPRWDSPPRTNALSHYQHQPRITSPPPHHYPPPPPTPPSTHPPHHHHQQQQQQHPHHSDAGSCIHAGTEGIRLVVVRCASQSFCGCVDAGWYAHGSGRICMLMDRSARTWIVLHANGWFSVAFHVRVPLGGCGEREK